MSATGYEVQLADTARRDLRSVPPRIVSAIIEFLYGDLARNPHTRLRREPASSLVRPSRLSGVEERSNEHRVGKPLQRELEGLFGARRGPYRIIYDVQDERLLVLVIHIDYRADIYRH